MLKHLNRFLGQLPTAQRQPCRLAAVMAAIHDASKAGGALAMPSIGDGDPRSPSPFGSYSLTSLLRLQHVHIGAVSPDPNDEPRSTWAPM